MTAFQDLAEVAKNKFMVDCREQVLVDGKIEAKMFADKSDQICVEFKPDGDKSVWVGLPLVIKKQMEHQTMEAQRENP